MVTQASVQKFEVPHVIWWLVLLEGIAAFVVGILILAAPGISAVTLTTLLGAYWFVSGIFSLVSIFMSRKSWGWKLATGILGIISGLIVLQYPMLSAVVVPEVAGIYLGVMGIIIGVMRLIQSYRGAGWGMAILGALSVLLGFTLLLFPPLAILTAIYAFAILCLAGGISAFFVGLSLRRGGEVSVVSVTPPMPLAPAAIPVTGKMPEEHQPESEHPGEETGEYTGEEEGPDKPGHKLD